MLGAIFRRRVSLPLLVSRHFSQSAQVHPYQAPFEIKFFPHGSTGTNSFVLHDKASKEGMVIDPVADFDFSSGTVSYHTQTADMLEYIIGAQIRVSHILETHVHADHITSSAFMKARLGGTPRIAVSSKIIEVQTTFAPLLHDSASVCDGSEFDMLLKEGDEIELGAAVIRMFATPGHTPACMSFSVTGGGNGDNPICLFTGDTLFHESLGCARADFPGGDANQLWRSLQRILSFPEDTVLLYGHDYPGESRAREYATTVGQAKQLNPVLQYATEEEFVDFRSTRDGQLSVPALLWPSIQINMRAGKLPAHLSIPLTVRE
jgi:glyoxylase-like metal-dependent hydrolase (beta-lactamase superfamily II)